MDCYSLRTAIALSARWITYARLACPARVQHGSCVRRPTDCYQDYLEFEALEEGLVGRRWAQEPPVRPLAPTAHRLQLRAHDGGRHAPIATPTAHSRTVPSAVEDR